MQYLEPWGAFKGIMVGTATDPAVILASLVGINPTKSHQAVNFTPLVLMAFFENTLPGFQGLFQKIITFGCSKVHCAAGKTLNFEP